MTRRLRVVDILAFGAVESDSALVGNIMQAHREEVLTLTQNAGAFAEVAIFVLFSLSEEREGQLSSPRIKRDALVTITHTILPRPRVVTMYLA